MTIRTAETYPSDPMERIIAEALRVGGIAFLSEQEARSAGAISHNLDFHLMVEDVAIEVKQFHAERIGRQMAQHPDVIVAQGRRAVAFLSEAIAALGRERMEMVRPANDGH